MESKSKNTKKALVLVSIAILSMILIFSYYKFGSNSISRETSDSIDDNVELEKKTEEMSKTPDQSKHFDVFLTSFFTQYINKDGEVHSHINPNIGMILITKPGAMHYGKNSNKVIFADLKINNSNIFNEVPDGHLCDGYFKAKDGMYFYKTISDNFPKYFDDTNNEVRLSLPENYSKTELREVLLIENHFIVAYFYFALIEGNWCLICQKFSDCMA
jgi:hypothetical protein